MQIPASHGQTTRPCAQIVVQDLAFAPLLKRISFNLTQIERNPRQEPLLMLRVARTLGKADKGVNLASGDFARRLPCFGLTLAPSCG